MIDVANGRWARVDAKGAKPSPRHKHTLVATRTGGLLLFGGNDFGPTRGFYEIDVSSDASASLAADAPRTPLTALLAASVQLLQLLALLMLAAASWLRRLGMIGGAKCAAAVSASIATLYGAEQIAPPPGALLARALRMPKPARTGRPAVGFERSRLSSATDAAAALAAAGLASLVASAGGPPTSKLR